MRILRGARNAAARIAAGLVGALLVPGCGSATAPPGTVTGRPLKIVAAENFWGSIAKQIGGIGAITVTSIIDNPAADPHDYEPTPADARAVATADLVIVNGVGYDGWADRLLAASPGRTVIDIGKLVGAKSGDNPHLWYDPADVQTFIGALTSDLQKLDPAAAGGFERGRTTFESQGLKAYDSLIADIKRKYSGTPVGASESIFSLLAPALGLNLITPQTFLRAISEGNDVSAADKTTIDRQIATRQLRIYVYNSQNTTPDVAAQLTACRAEGIPTATITETLAPVSDSYQQWQSTQLRGIAVALAKGTGR